MSKNFLNTVIALISIILALHYFASYCWFAIIFEQYNLTTYNLLSIEDVLFTWAYMNIILSKPLLWLPLLLYSLFEIFSQFPFIKKQLTETRQRAYKRFHQSRNWKDVILLIIITIPIVSLILIFKSSFAITWSIVFVTMLILWIFLLPSKRNILIPIMIFASILVGSSIYEALKHSSSKSKFRDHVKIELRNGDKIETNSCRHFIFMGSKYAIFRDACSQIIELYPTNEIKSYSIKKDSIPKIKNNL